LPLVNCERGGGSKNWRWIKLRYPTYLWCLFHAINNNGALFSCHTPSGATLSLGSFVRTTPHEVAGPGGCCARYLLKQVRPTVAVATVRCPILCTDVHSLTTWCMFHTCAAVHYKIGTYKPKKTKGMFVANGCMRYRQIMALYCGNHAEHINTLYRKMNSCFCKTWRYTGYTSDYALQGSTGRLRVDATGRWCHSRPIWSLAWTFCFSNLRLYNLAAGWSSFLTADCLNFRRLTSTIVDVPHR